MLKQRLKLFLTTLTAGAALWAIAPALTTAQYMPDAVDFEQSLPEAERVSEAGASAVRARSARSERRHGRGRRDHGRGHGRIKWQTPAIEAPKRFDLVGVAGEEADLDLRVRDHDGEWTEWVTVTDGNPLYTGGADEVQVRSAGPRIEGKLHYVNVNGDETAAHGLLNTVRGAVNSGLISTIGAAPADAASRKPSIVSREDWGADDCRPRQSPQYGKVKAAVVHHTVSANEYTEAEAPGMVLGICRYHRNGNGWNDVGYNALVDRFGNIYEGRAGGLDQAVIGAQAQGVNTYTTGVAVMGNQSTVAPTGKSKRALIKFLAWKLDVHGRRARGKTRLRSAGGSTNRYPSGQKVRVKRIFGHGTTNLTECPGSLLAPQVNKIKRRVAKRMARFSDEGPATDPDAPEAGGTVPQRKGKRKSARRSRTGGLRAR